MHHVTVLQVLQQIFNANTEAEVLAGLNKATSLGYACAQSAPTASSPLAGDGLSLGGGSNHGFTAYCLNGTEQNSLFGGGGGGGAGFQAAFGQLTNSSSQSGITISIGNSANTAIGAEVDE